MSSASDQINPYPWRKPSPEQEVSNRPVWRIQSIANDLGDRLNRLPTFSRNGEGIIQDVFFASRDPEASLGSERRWYRFRLCGTYKFEFPENVYVDPWDWLETNVSRFEVLFRAAALHTKENRFDHFKSAAASASPDKGRALDEFVRAVGEVPYRGVLLSLFEQATFGEERPMCLWFEGTENEISLWKFDKFIRTKKLISQEPQADLELLLPKEDFSDDDLKNLNDLYGNFILPFTRGGEPNKLENSESTSNEWPYSSAKEDLFGFVIPAYDDAFSDSNRWRGGMTGWLVFFVDRPYSKAFARSYPRDLWSRICGSSSTRNPQGAWQGFRAGVQTFTRRERETEMRALVDKYTDSSSVPEPDNYFRSHIHHFTDWKVASDETGEQDNLIEYELPGSRTEEIPGKTLSIFRLDKTQFEKDQVDKPSKDDRWLLESFRRNLWRAWNRSEEQRKRTIAETKARVSHGIQTTINQVLTHTWQISKAILNLKSDSSNFPIASFNELPESIRQFGYPHSLYLVGVENASQPGVSEDEFKRWLPRLDWITDQLRSNGINSHLLNDLDERIARPLAKKRLPRIDKKNADLVKIHVKGGLAIDRLSFLTPEGQEILVVLIAEMLREAIQHCDPNNPHVHVELHPRDDCLVAVLNGTQERDLETRKLQSENGNFERTSKVLIDRANNDCVSYSTARLQISRPETVVLEDGLFWVRRICLVDNQ